MTVTPSSPIVGVFTDRAMAEQAVEALYDAGFAQEQIRYTNPGNSGSFFGDLKSLFTGTSTNDGNIANDLTTMGLSDEEARYYSNEYNNGNTILSVQAQGREQEALSILHQYGARNSSTQNASNQATSSVSQTTDTTQQDNYGTPQPQNNTQSWLPQPQFGTSAEQAFEGHGQAIATPEHDAEYETTQPMPSEQSGTHDTWTSQATSENTAEPQPVQADTNAPDYNAQSAPGQPTMSVPGQETGYQQSPINVAAPAYATEDRPAQSSMPAPDPAAQAQPPQTDATAQYQQPDEAQQLQEQLRAAQQQLAEVKAQLQAAKEQETQLQSARERQQQLQTAKQQLEDIQSELASALEELRQTNTRLTQYQ